MKSILFFDREELTDFFILLTQAIGERMRIFHVAYTEEDAIKLRNAGIIDYYHYGQHVSEKFHSEHLDSELLDQIDILMIENSNGRFNLNSSIQSDRGFSLLSYSEALLSAQVHYQCWNEIFNRFGKIDYLLHEPCSLYFNHIAALLCKAQGGIYIWHALTHADFDGDTYLNINNDDYSSIEIKTYFERYLHNPDSIDYERCKKFVSDFRNDFTVLLAGVMSKKESKLQLSYRAWREKIGNFVKYRQYDRLCNNIEYWMHTLSYWGDKVRNLKDYKKDKIIFEEPQEGEDYYYYSFHLEPESVVLYLGDGIYANQVKLIENIAASLPPKTYLYVKDHPHELAYRCSNDYLRLMKVPNIRLIRQTIPGKMLIKNAIGVFTINGTAGFEALVLGKQVYYFGWNYNCYYPKVNYIRNIRDLRDIIYKNRGKQYEDDVMFYAYINAFLDAAHPGFINYFMGLADKCCKDPVANAQVVADDLVKYCNTVW